MPNIPNIPGFHFEAGAQAMQHGVAVGAQVGYMVETASGARIQGIAQHGQFIRTDGGPALAASTTASIGIKKTF